MNIDTDLYHQLSCKFDIFDCAIDIKCPILILKCKE